MRIHRIGLVGFLLCGLGGTAWAERYALLVGVSKYAVDGPRVHLNLEGPALDVAALKKRVLSAGLTVSRQWTFRPRRPLATARRCFR